MPELAYVVLVGGRDDDTLKQMTMSLEAEALAAGRMTRVIFAKLTRRSIIHSKGEKSAPNLRDIFEAGESAVSQAETNHFIYVNSDIIFAYDTMRTFSQVLQTFTFLEHRVVISGARTDCVGKSSNFNESLDYDSLSVARLFVQYDHCISHPPTGKDYFVYMRGFWQRQGGIPNFMIGRTAWDDYLAAVANLKGIFVDASAVVTALHLEHSYCHSGASCSKESLWQSRSAKRNRKILKKSCQRITKGGTCRGYNLNEANFRACPTMSGDIVVRQATRWSFDEGWMSVVKNFTTWPRECSFAREVFKCAHACSR
jgi:hypothetical protein